MTGKRKVVLALCLILLTFIAAVSVVWCYKTELAEKNDMKVYLDKQQKEFKDKAGSNVPPVEYNGKTYLPLEPVTGLVGIEFEWDKEKQSIYISDDSNSNPKVRYRNKDIRGELTVMHFNRDVRPGMEEYFKQAYPNIDLHFITIANGDFIFKDRIKVLLRSGGNVPDVFALESVYAKEIINNPDTFSDLTDRAKDYVDDMIPYTVQFGTDKNGALRALADTAAPGAIAYKKGVAKKYLGTDNPSEIADMLSTPEKVLQTARILKEKSGGKVALFPSFEEMLRICLGGRSNGWVVNNKLNIDKAVWDFIDFAKTLRDNNYELGIDQWSTEWSTAIGDDEKALAWSCPSWGIPWIVGSNDKKAADGGRWGLIKPSFPYFWGGTWYGVYSKSPNQDTAWEFIKFFTTDKEMMKVWANEKQELPNNMKLLEEGSAQKDKIMGTDVFKFFEPFVRDINGKTVTEYDDSIYYSFRDSMKSYLIGKIKSKEELIKEFKKKVKSSVKDIVVQ